MPLVSSMFNENHSIRQILNQLISSAKKSLSVLENLESIKGFDLGTEKHYLNMVPRSDPVYCHRCYSFTVSFWNVDLLLFCQMTAIQYSHLLRIVIYLKVGSREDN